MFFKKTQDITSGMKEWFLAHETKEVVVNNGKFTVNKTFLDYVELTSEKGTVYNVPFRSIHLFKAFET